MLSLVNSKKKKNRTTADSTTLVCHADGSKNATASPHTYEFRFLPSLPHECHLFFVQFAYLRFSSV